MPPKGAEDCISRGEMYEISKVSGTFVGRDDLGPPNRYTGGNGAPGSSRPTGGVEALFTSYVLLRKTQSSVSLRLTAPFQRSLALRGTAELHGEAFGQTRTCGFDRRIRAQRVQALGAPEYKNAPAPTRRGAVNRSQERPNLRYLAVCTGQNR